MKKNIFIITIVSALLIINIYSLSKLLYTQKKANATIRHTRELYNNANVFYKIIHNDLLLSNYSDNYPVNSNLKLKSNYADSVILSDLINNGNKLVVYYSYLDCNSCIEFQLDIIRKYINKLNKNNVLFIATYSNLREHQIDTKVKDLGCPIYYIINNSLQIPVEKQNEPFFFLIDKNMYTKHVFIPRKEIPKLTEDYMELIYKRYFSN